MRLPSDPVGRLARGLGLEPFEMGGLAFMGALVAVLLAAYTVAKVLRDALFLSQFGAYALPYAYIGTALASVLFVWVEAWASRRFTQVGAMRLHQYSAVAASAMAAVYYPLHPHHTAAVFYVWSGSQAMLLLSHFWVLALDVWDSQRARRLFPLLTGCGLIGGLAGGALAGWSLPMFPRSGLMWEMCVLFAASHVLTLRVERYRTHHDGVVEQATGDSRWRILRQSRYLRMFALALALSVVVSTLVDFQFKAWIQRLYPDAHGLTQFLGRFYVGLNSVALLLQFGAAGWLIQRLGLAASSGLPPLSVMVLAAWVGLTTGGWAVLALRWVQGVLFQTIGKSATEIYYSVVRASERRRIKPIIDTLVERWSDAAVGVLLIVVVRTLHVPMRVLAFGTAGLAAAWLAMLIVVHRGYGALVGQLLSRRWDEHDSVPESLRDAGARRALATALGSADERRTVLALELARHVRDPRVVQAVQARLGDPSPAVRAAAVAALTALGVAADAKAVETLLADPSDAVRRAAVTHRFLLGRDRVEFARQLLESGDPALRLAMADALYLRPYDAQRAVRWDVVDAWLAAPDEATTLLAVRVAGAVPTRPAATRLEALLGHASDDVRRATLLALATRPRRELLGRVLSLLTDRAVAPEARAATAALGNVAVVPLRRLLQRSSDPAVQAAAAGTLAAIANPGAAATLARLTRRDDVRVRHVAFRGLARARLRLGRPVLSQRAAHRLFRQELRSYRTLLEPWHALRRHPRPEVRLLGDSYRESADLALERAIHALAAWYEPGPLFGAYERLHTGDRVAQAPALEHLAHILPRRVHGDVLRTFDVPVAPEATPPGPDEVAARVRMAWASGDVWLRACAVRASRFASGAPAFTPEPDEHPLVLAELRAAALPATPPLRTVPPSGAGARAAAEPRAARGAPC